MLPNLKEAVDRAEKQIEAKNPNLENKEEVEKMFITLNIDSKIRGEKLTLEQFGEIANYLTKTL